MKNEGYVMYKMNKFSLVVVVFLATCCLVSCQQDSPQKYMEWIDPIVPGELPKVSFFKSATDFNAFALESYAKTRSTANPDDNS